MRYDDLIYILSWCYWWRAKHACHGSQAESCFGSVKQSCAGHKEKEIESHVNINLYLNVGILPIDICFWQVREVWEIQEKGPGSISLQGRVSVFLPESLLREWPVGSLEVRVLSSVLGIQGEAVFMRRVICSECVLGKKKQCTVTTTERACSPASAPVSSFLPMLAAEWRTKSPHSSQTGISLLKRRSCDCYILGCSGAWHLTLTEMYLVPVVQSCNYPTLYDTVSNLCA